MSSGGLRASGVPCLPRLRPAHIRSQANDNGYSLCGHCTHVSYFFVACIKYVKELFCIGGVVVAHPLHCKGITSLFNFKINKSDLLNICFNILIFKDKNLPFTRVSLHIPSSEPNSPPALRLFRPRTRVRGTYIACFFVGFFAPAP